MRNIVFIIGISWIQSTCSPSPEIPAPTPGPALTKAAENPIDSTFFIQLDRTDHGTIIPCRDSRGRHIRKEFSLTVPPARYAIEIWEDSISILQYWDRSAWKTLDTLSRFTAIFGYLDCTFDFPHAVVQDFDEDGYQDLRCNLVTNINGNSWGKIFLFDKAAGHLIPVRSAEADELWAAPYFNPADRTIREEQVSGVYGLSYTSIYKLENHVAIPVQKEEVDNEGLGADGKGGVKRVYTGRNGKWKLKKQTSI